jgi:Ion channel
MPNKSSVSISGPAHVPALMPTAALPRPRSIFFGSDRGMAFFLAFLVLATIFLPMVTLSRFGRLSLSLIFVLTLISGALVTIEQTLVKYLVVGLTAATLAVSLAVEFSGLHTFLLTSLRLTCSSLLVLMILKRTFRAGPVTRYRVMGGIAAYLLIGYTWAFGYQLLVQFEPTAIRFEGAPSADVSNDLMYFSFITLTTVGYGDVHPVHPMVRSLAVAEALVGQLYIAILIASLVGMALQTRSTKQGMADGAEFN